MVLDAGPSGERWGRLIKHFGLLPRDEHEVVVQGLKLFDIDAATKVDLDAIAEALRREVTRHRRFPDAEWAMPRDLLEEAEELLERFEASDSPLRHAWLFSYQAQLPIGPELGPEEEHEELATARRDAVEGLLADSGLDGIWALVEACEDVELVGKAVGEADFPDDDGVLDHLRSPDHRVRAFAEAFVAGRFNATGAKAWDWAGTRWAGMRDSPSEQRAAFLANLPPVSKTLDWAEQDWRTSRAYWERFDRVFLPEPAELPRVVSRLLEHGRGVTCVSLLSTHLRRGPDEGADDMASVAPDLIADAAETAAQEIERQGDGQSSQMLAYDIARLLAHLADDGGLDQSRIARLEWLYLPLLDSTGYPPKVLHGELGRDAGFFAEVVFLAYRPDDEAEDTELTQGDRIRAHLGYQLLESWTSVPGIRDDGSVDPQALRAWIEVAQGELSRHGRRSSGDRQIGRLLRYAPEDPDGTWPPAAVRRVIEDSPDPLRELEEGLEDQVYNDPNQRKRTLTAGGSYGRRTLARRYAGYANRLDTTSSRTRRLLRRIAERFERDARWAEEREELGEDLGP